MALRFAGIGFPDVKNRAAYVSQLKFQRNPADIPVERDRAFRIVTDDSGHCPKSVTFKRNQRSRCRVMRRGA